jgi:hypothetical protein
MLVAALFAIHPLRCLADVLFAADTVLLLHLD